MTLVSTVRRAALRLTALAPVLLAVVALSLASREARAQTVSGIVGTVGRFEPSGANADDYTNGNPHPGGVPLNVVNFEDCEADLSFQFQLSLSAIYANYDLVAWAGPDDCTAAAAREAPNPTPIAQNGATDAGTPVTVPFKIKMRDLVAHAGTPAATYPISTTYAAAGEDVCSAQSTDVQTAISIYFFFANHVGPGDAIGIAQAYPIVADTRAQTLGSGTDIGFSLEQDLDSQLTVTVTAASDPDTVLYNIYCDPPPGQETVANKIPVDAATNGGKCTLDSGSSTVVDASGNAVDSATPLGQDASDDANAAASDDASTVDAGSAADAGADAASEDAGAPSAQDSGQPTAIFDDAGGDLCGVPLNDAGISGFAGCAGSILKSGGGSTVTTLVPETDDAGIEITDDAGNPIYVEAGVPGNGTQVLDIPAKNLCGTLLVGNSTFTLTGLKDGYDYMVGVAAVDNAGNVGPLAVACDGPVQLADFWYDYATAGGQAGGGYCSSASAGIGVPAGTGGLGVLMVASIIGMVRVRARKRRR